MQSASINMQSTDVRIQLTSIRKRPAYDLVQSTVDRMKSGSTKTLSAANRLESAGVKVPPQGTGLIIRFS